MGIGIGVFGNVMHSGRILVQSPRAYPNGTFYRALGRVLSNAGIGSRYRGFVQKGLSVNKKFKD